MLTKTADIKLKVGPDDGLEEGQFVAYASVFGNRDSYGDVVMPGAFTEDLARWEKSGYPIPLLFGHNMSDPDFNIGHVVKAEEDAVGLKITGELDLTNPKGLQVYKLIKGRRINQMSFAYDEVDSGPGVHDGENVWELRTLKLYEVSVVTIGANQETEILAVKQVPNVAERAMKDIKAGRVLSAKNENEVRDAYEALGRVLTALDGTPDEEKASGDGPSRQVPVDPAGKQADEEPREASQSPSVDTSAIERLALEIDLAAL